MLRKFNKAGSSSKSGRRGRHMLQPGVMIQTVDSQTQMKKKGLDEILTLGRSSGDQSGLGYSANSSSKLTNHVCQRSNPKECWDGLAFIPSHLLEVWERRMDVLNSGERESFYVELIVLICRMAFMKYGVEKFSGKRNFRIWQSQVKDILVQKGLYRTWSGKKPPSMDNDTWEEMEMKAVSLIRLCLAEEVAYNVIKETSAPSLWLKLEKMYMTKSLSNKLYLKNQLYNARMAKGANLLHYINRFNNIVTQLLSNEVNLDEDDKVLIFLNSLPPSFEHLVLRKSPNLNSNGEGLFAKQASKDRGRSKERGHDYRDKSRSKSKGKGKIRCYFCKQEGHIKRQCPKRLESLKKKGKDVDQASMDSYSNSWILDYGCSSHMCPHRSWFSTFVDYNGGKVLMGNNAAYKTVGMGTIKIKMFDDIVRTFADVRYVLEMKKSFISLGALDSNSCSFSTTSGIMKVKKGSMVVMKGEKKMGNLYHLIGNTIIGGTAVTSCDGEDDATVLWHRRLGHMSERGLQELHIHVWGPASVVSMGGAKYFISFIDDFSRKVRTGKEVKCLRTDNGGEFTGRDFKDFCKNEGIVRHFTTPGTLQQNGVAERMNRTLLEKERCMRLLAELPKVFWAEAVNTACYIINRTPTTIELKKPEEVWTASLLKGVQNEVQEEKKNKAIVQVDLENTKGKKICVQPYSDRDGSSSSQVELHGDDGRDTTELEFDVPSGGVQDAPVQESEPYAIAKGKGKRNIAPPVRYMFEDMVSFALTMRTDDPSTFSEAIKVGDSDVWLHAMKEEMESLLKNQTWELVELPKGKE
ncbi:hypothetical protein H6P81_012404 [Aristolochia fimbriata]|uniref:Retrovirus-related Pol polyprotein from transposon TNT 1-94 n=1 Tax=Aristolochia fimbriata TaxID=158543 RepID=A0AAV7EEH8_ARIFI|nr:hypothetical protein H6P81_012404 [Aristolochia fimbriata]